MKRRKLELFPILLLLLFISCSPKDKIDNPVFNLSELIELSDYNIDHFDSYISKRGFEFESKEDQLTYSEYGVTTVFTYLFKNKINKSFSENGSRYFMLIKGVGKNRNVSLLYYVTSEKHIYKSIFDEVSKSFPAEKKIEPKGDGIVIICKKEDLICEFTSNIIIVNGKEETNYYITVRRE